MLQTQNEFKIVIPKSYNLTEEESFEIFWEYHIMAYTGQKLYEISSEFSYNVPSARSIHPFIFIINVNDLEKLADVLYDLVLLRQEDDLDVTTAFQLAASNFFIDAYDNRVEPVTWGLLTMANAFLAE